MTSFRRQLAFGLVFAALAQVAASASVQPDPLAPLPRRPSANPHAGRARAHAPAVFAEPAHRSRTQVRRQGRHRGGVASGRMGSGLERDIAVPAAELLEAMGRDHRSGRRRSRQGQPRPRGSRSTASDLTLFHQPLAAKILDGSLQSITLGELMFTAITQSDNTANDKLLRSIGGPPAVRRMIARKGLGAIRFGNGERSLQSRIAGLTGSPSYSIGSAFFDARTALPMRRARPRSSATSTIPTTARRRTRSPTRLPRCAAAACSRRNRPTACCRPWARRRPERLRAAPPSPRAGSGTTRPERGRNSRAGLPESTTSACSPRLTERSMRSPS